MIQPKIEQFNNEKCLRKWIKLIQLLKNINIFVKKDTKYISYKRGFIQYDLLLKLFLFYFYLRYYLFTAT